MSARSLLIQRALPITPVLSSMSMPVDIVETLDAIYSHIFSYCDGDEGFLFVSRRGQLVDGARAIQFILPGDINGGSRMLPIVSFSFSLSIRPLSEGICLFVTLGCQSCGTRRVQHSMSFCRVVPRDANIEETVCRAITEGISIVYSDEISYHVAFSKVHRWLVRALSPYPIPELDNADIELIGGTIDQMEAWFPRLLPDDFVHNGGLFWFGDYPE